MALMRLAAMFVLLAVATLAADSSRFAAGMNLYRADKCQAALAEFQASQEAAEPEPERPLYQGICLAKASQWQQAAAYLAQFTTVRPADVRGWYWLAQSHLYARDFDRAKTDMERAIQLDPKSADNYRTLGEIELERKDHDAAYRAWIRANQLDPQDARTTYYLGRLFFEADFPDQAAAWFRQTLKSAPHHFAAMTYLGLCAERLNMEKTALDLYSAAIRESKEQQKPYSWAFLSYAKLLRQSGKDPQALAVLQEAEQVCPEAHVLTALGQLLAATDSAKAVAVLRRAIAMDPSISEAHYRLALLLRAQGDAAAAQAEMQAFQNAKAAEERNKPTIQAIRRNP